MVNNLFDKFETVSIGSLNSKSEIKQDASLKTGSAGVILALFKYLQLRCDEVNAIEDKQGDHYKLKSQSNRELDHIISDAILQNIENNQLPQCLLSHILQILKYLDGLFFHESELHTDFLWNHPYSAIPEG